MTLYLWYIPPLLAMHLVFDYFGHPRYDPTPRLHRAQSSAVGHHGHPGCLGVRRAAPVGEQPAPLWDGGFVAGTGSRSAAVGALLCVAGAATLASVGWGLKGPGLYCVAVMLAALVGARFLATDPRVTAQRVCAASRPASTR